MSPTFMERTYHTIQFSSPLCSHKKTKLSLSFSLLWPPCVSNHPCFPFHPPHHTSSYFIFNHTHINIIWTLFYSMPCMCSYTDTILLTTLLAYFHHHRTQDTHIHTERERAQPDYVAVLIPHNTLTHTEREPRQKWQFLQQITTGTGPVPLPSPRCRSSHRQAPTTTLCSPAFSMA